MPIAHCILSDRIAAKSSDSAGLIEKWGKYSKQDSTEMTVTIVLSEQQIGHTYGAICTLHLPNLWSPKSISLLQLGLAKAIAEHYGLKASDVLVMTSVIDSGHVVEGGKEIRW